VWLPCEAHGIAQAAGKDTAVAARKIELVNTSPALLNFHARLGDVAERADADIELFAIGARQQAPRPMPRRLERRESLSRPSDAIRARRIWESHHAVGIADIESLAQQRHAERLVQSLHECPT